MTRAFHPMHVLVFKQAFLHLCSNMWYHLVGSNLLRTRCHTNTFVPSLGNLPIPCACFPTNIYVHRWYNLVYSIPSLEPGALQTPFPYLGKSTPHMCLIQTSIDVHICGTTLYVQFHLRNQRPCKHLLFLVGTRGPAWAFFFLTQCYPHGMLSIFPNKFQ